MKKKNPQNKLQSLQKMKVITGITKGENIYFTLELQLRPLLNSFKEYKEYLQSNYNGGDKEVAQAEIYRKRTLRIWNKAFKLITDLNTKFNASGNKSELKALKEILKKYYFQLNHESFLPEIATGLESIILHGQRKKRTRISKQEKDFLKIKDEIDPKSFGKFVYALSAKGLEYSNSTYSRLWNKYYSG
ncbi:MAG: hypothetical protein DYG99_09050 [Bacteroidetes bacterium CHB5]|nr:hypothetical protein [Bacteroidetes bacterium CHB5]